MRVIDHDGRITIELTRAEAEELAAMLRNRYDSSSAITRHLFDALEALVETEEPPCGRPRPAE